LKLSTARIEVLIWVLIYAGMLSCGLGIALSRGGKGYGREVAAAGMVAAVVGVVLIWVRSRIQGRGGA
jgi:vacuolar-type H+-ATPase subunit I/STV1